MHKYLLKPDVRKPGEKKFSDFLKAAAPISIPQNTDYRSKLPPIWDQGQLGACQSYAADAIDQYIKDYSYEPSHIFTYYNVRKVEGNPPDEDTGGTLSGTCEAIKQYGICNSAIWPNDIARYAVEPSAVAYADGLAGNDGLVEFYRVESVDEARQALAVGHLPFIGIEIYENFETEEVMKSGIIPAPAGRLLGGHALDIVGHHDNIVVSWSEVFRDLFTGKWSAFWNGLKTLIFGKQPASKGYFLIRNSWGVGIGLGGSGYFRVDYEVLEKLLMDMWIVVK